jgi:hypothetical protein
LFRLIYTKLLSNGAASIAERHEPDHQNNATRGIPAGGLVR